MGRGGRGVWHCWAVSMLGRGSIYSERRTRPPSTHWGKNRHVSNENSRSPQERLTHRVGVGDLSLRENGVNSKEPEAEDGLG